MFANHQKDVVDRVLADRPSFHLAGSAHWDALPATLRAVARVTRPHDVTLEVGAGVSTVVFTAAGARHTAVSPDPTEHQLIREYCKKIGVDDSNLNFICGFSDDVLPSHLSRERNLDVAMVDGAHSFPLPIVDWYFLARALKVGGTLILDDVPVPAVMPLFEHMRLESTWKLNQLLDNRAAEFILLHEPTGGDDWRKQAFNKRYPDFSYLSPASSLLRKAEFHALSTRAFMGRRFPALRRLRNQSGVR